MQFRNGCDLTSVTRSRTARSRVMLWNLRSRAGPGQTERHYVFRRVNDTPIPTICLKPRHERRASACIWVQRRQPTGCARTRRCGPARDLACLGRSCLGSEPALFDAGSCACGPFGPGGPIGRRFGGVRTEAGKSRHQRRAWGRSSRAPGAGASYLSSYAAEGIEPAILALGPLPNSEAGVSLTCQCAKLLFAGCAPAVPRDVLSYRDSCGRPCPAWRALSPAADGCWALSVHVAAAGSYIVFVKRGGNGHSGVESTQAQRPGLASKSRGLAFIEPELGPRTLPSGVAGGRHIVSSPRFQQLDQGRAVSPGLGHQGSKQSEAARRVPP